MAGCSGGTQRTHTITVRDTELTVLILPPADGDPTARAMVHAIIMRTIQNTFTIARDRPYALQLRSVTPGRWC